MQLKDFQSKCPGVRLKLSELEVDPTQLIEHSFFENRNVSDYRNATIDYMNKNKIDWHSTCNSAFSVMKRFTHSL